MARRYPSWTAYLFDDNGPRGGGVLRRYRVLAHLNNRKAAMAFLRAYKKKYGQEFPGYVTPDWAY